MPFTLELEPVTEQCLREIAEARGLSAEGYLLTLIEALVEPEPPRRSGIRRVWRELLRRKEEPQPVRTVADGAVHRMKAELLLHKERTVEAVTKANLLQKTAERLQAVIVERELQALTLARDGDKRALAKFQESCVYGENLQFTKSQIKAAANEAETLLRAFQQAEKRVKARLSAAQAGALEGIDNEFTRTCLTREQMERRIIALGDAERWQARFDDWVRQFTTVLETEIEDLPETPLS